MPWAQTLVLILNWTTVVWMLVMLWRLRERRAWFVGGLIWVGAIFVLRGVAPDASRFDLKGSLVVGMDPILVSAFRLAFVVFADRMIISALRDRARYEHSQRRYLGAARAGRVGVWEWNIKQNCLVIDPVLKNLLGFEDHEISSEIPAWEQLVHPDDRESLTLAISAALASDGEVYEHEHRLLSKSGEARWFISRGVIVRDSEGVACSIVGADADINDRKQAAEELGRARKQLEWLVEERTSQLTAANTALRAEVAHRERSEGAIRAIAEGVSSAVGEEFFDALVTHIGEALEIDCVCIARRVGDSGTLLRVLALWNRGALSRGFEADIAGNPCERLIEGDAFVIASGARDTFPLSSQLAEFDAEAYLGAPILAPNGEFLGQIAAIHGSPVENPEELIPILRICAARAGVEFERQKIEDALRQSHKMQAIGALAGGIAHDFNNVLTSIMLNAELAMGAASPDSVEEDHLREVLWASERGRDLVRQILAFARTSEPAVSQPLEATPVVKESLKLLRASIPSNIEVRESLESDAGVLLGDPSQLQQIVVNLCTNAYQSLGTKGGLLEVSLAAARYGEESAGRPRGLAPGAYVRLAVADDGPGVAEELRERIFEPFFTTKHSRASSGLGLSVVHGIVTRYGGTIDLESNGGGGCCFVVHLPSQAAPPSADRVRHPGPVKKSGGERILFVDDETSLVKAAGQALKIRGYQVTARSDSSESLALFRDDPEQFDFAVLDITMPQLTGVDLAREMLSIRSDLPIILATGYSELITPEEAEKMGIKEIVLKPYTMHDLSATIRRILNGGD